MIKSKIINLFMIWKSVRSYLQKKFCILDFIWVLRFVILIIRFDKCHYI